MTRQEALRAGATQYVGKPCRYGHPGLRLLSDRTCLECHRLRSRRLRAANPEKKRAETYAWRRTNPTAYRAIARRSTRKYQRERRARDLNFRIMHVLRSRLAKALHGSVSAVRGLGCSVEELRTHLETRFQLGMTWENYGGRHGWQIDHIRPLSAFDLTDPEQAKRAVHFTNLQPLWAAQNLKKRARITEAPGG